MKINEILIESKAPNLADREFEIDGYVYKTMQDDYGDVVKISHYIETPYGEVLEPDWSPYNRMTPDDVELYIKLGAPERIGLGPLNRKDLEQIARFGKQTQEALTEEQFDEAAGKKDACYHKVKSRYKVWPSAYASGALVKCRKVGAANWGNKSKK